MGKRETLVANHDKDAGQHREHKHALDKIAILIRSFPTNSVNAKKSIFLKPQHYLERRPLNQIF